MKLLVGSKVKFINENLEGEVIKILSDTHVLVNCSDGFELQVLVNELVAVGEENELIYKINEQELSEKLISKQPITSSLGILDKYIENNKYVYENVLEIDLHLEELVEFPEKLDDWHKLHTQLQHVKNCLEAAFQKNIKRIIFIHGVGTGVLKTELINYLSKIDNLTTKEVDYREYGMGATEVIIKN